jgi:hypothetical protein
MATAIELIRDAAVDVGVAEPATIVGGGDATARKLLRLANREGRILAQRHDWQRLTFTHSFTSVAAVIQANGMPDDFDRMVYNAEVWDRSGNFKFAGPTPSRAWQDLQTNLTGGVVGWWRLLGGELNIFPAQEAGRTFAYEYVGKNWVYRPSDDTYHDAIGQDGDEILLPEEVFISGIDWRWGASAKGYDYSEELSTYERMVELATTRDRGTGVIYPPPSESSMPPVPTWPGTITIP